MGRFITDTRRLAAILLTATLLVIAGLLWGGGGTRETATPPVVASAPDSKIEQARQANAVWRTQPIEARALPPLPELLAQARPRIVLETDAAGNLVIDQQLPELFEFYLSALDYEPLDQVLERLHHALADQLEGAALAQARDVLGRYVDYKIALAELDEASASTPPADTVAGLRGRLAAVDGIRQQLFQGQEYEVFFALERAQDEVALQQFALAQDTSLTPEQRQQAARELTAQLPREIRALNQRISRDGELYARTEALREAGAGDDVIFRERAKVLGPEAATALADLDQQRAQWQLRVSDYRQAQQAIRQSGLSPADQDAAIARLRNSRFAGPERLRVQALETEW